MSDKNLVGVIHKAKTSTILKCYFQLKTLIYICCDNSYTNSKKIPCK